MYDNIKKIEASVYPSFMQYLQEVDTLEDMQDYCESKTVHILEEEHYYVIGAKTEIVDVAADKPLSLQDVVAIKNFLVQCYKGKTVTLDARASTSYPLIKLYEKRGVIKVLEEELWHWGDEAMYEMTIKFI